MIKNTAGDNKINEMIINNHLKSFEIEEYKSLAKSKETAKQL